MDVQQSLEMGLSREEFLRLLPAAVASDFTVNGGTFHGQDGVCRWHIRLTPLADHRVGSVAVPRHRVEIVLQGCTEAEAEVFMARFHRAFLRGGG
jgi:hypothetical protein